MFMIVAAAFEMVTNVSNEKLPWSVLESMVQAFKSVICPDYDDIPWIFAAEDSAALRNDGVSDMLQSGPETFAADVATGEPGNAENDGLLPHDPQPEISRNERILGCPPQASYQPLLGSTIIYPGSHQQPRELNDLKAMPQDELGEHCRMGNFAPSTTVASRIRDHPAVTTRYLEETFDPLLSRHPTSSLGASMESSKSKAKRINPMRKHITNPLAHT